MLLHYTSLHVHTDGTDYTGLSEVVSVLPQGRACTEITVFNDQVVENAELFLVTLETADPYVILSTANASVTLLDDDGMQPVCGIRPLPDNL